MKAFFINNLIKQVCFFAVLVFVGSYFVFSNILSSAVTWRISADNPLQHQFLSQVLGTAEAADDLLRMELNGGGAGGGGGTSFTSFSCPAGGTAIAYYHNTGNNDRGYWYECYASRSAAAGFIPMTRLDGTAFSGPLKSGASAPPGTIGGYNGAGFSCESGSTLIGYNIYSGVSNDERSTWYACESNTPVPTPPPPPTFSPQPSCTGTSISANFSSAGASWYAVRLADLTSGSLISNGICDPASNSNETCQWQTGTSLNRTGIAGHTYRMWVHGATNTSWSPGTYSAATYATDFSCPAAPVATYSCTGTTPANANICAGDDSGLTANTNRTLVSGCTSGTKCEYVCSTGYVYSGGTCVLAGGGGPPDPTLTFSASPTSFPSSGGTTRLTWSTMNATSCSASGSWSGSKATGSGIWQDIPLSSSGSYTFSLECWNSASVSTGVHSATVTVAASGGFISPPAGYCVASPSPPNYADCSTWAKPTGLDPKNYFIVNHGAKNMTSCQESVTAPGTWITNVSMCYGSGCWSGSSPQTSSGQYEVATSYVSGTSYTYRCNSSTNIVEQNSGGGWSNVTWSSTGQNIRCVEVNTCSAPPLPTEPVTTTLEVVCTPITCGSLAGVAATYCTTDTFSTPDPCGGSITCPGTKSCSNSDANWREVAP